MSLLNKRESHSDDLSLAGNWAELGMKIHLQFPCFVYFELKVFKDKSIKGSSLRNPLMQKLISCYR